MSEFEEEKNENIVEKLNSTFVDFVGSVFGESGKEFVEDTQEKVQDFSSDSIKKFMEFSDDMLESLELADNENVMKTRDSLEDMLKQVGFLKEAEEEEF
ncbi:MAG: hypothetical protein R6U96_19290 [Promethearchaeia archaeon]